MDIYIPARSIDEARRNLEHDGFDRYLPLIDTLQWPWGKTYVFRAPALKDITPNGAT